MMKEGCTIKGHKTLNKRSCPYMKVKDLFNTFSDFEVLAGEGGLDRPLRTVTVMDAPDIYNWMKGGEFLITTGYCMKGDPREIEDLIIKLDRANTSALGIKLGRFIEKLPSTVKEMANRLNFPLINIPTKYAFSDVINPVLIKLVNMQTEKLMMSEKIHEAFFGLVIKGESTQDIVNTLGDILDRDVAFIDMFFNRTYLSGNDEEFIRDINKMDIVNLENKYSLYKIETSEDFYGYIIINHKHRESALEDLEEITIKHATTVLILDIQRKISNYEIGQKYRNEFVYDLIMNNVRTIDEVKNRASTYGWDMENGLVALIVDIDNFKLHYININQSQLEANKELENQRNQIFNISKSIIKNKFYKYYYTNFSDSITFLVESSGENIKQFIKKIKDTCDKIREEIKKNTRFTATIGVGSFQENFMDVYLSFKEAQKAVKISRTFNEGDRTVLYSELGAYLVSPYILSLIILQYLAIGLVIML